MPELSELFPGPAAYAPTVPPFPGERDTSAYRVGGVRVPSVTEVLDLAGFSEFTGIPRLVLENAANRGKWAHHYCERIIHGEVLDLAAVPSEVLPRLEAFRAFLHESQFVAAEVEIACVSTRYRYAGTIDLVGLLPAAGMSLIDVKLPISPSPAWALQTAGYAFAYHESVGVSVDARFALQLRDDGRYRLVHHSDDVDDLHDFLAALRVASCKIRHGLAQLAE
jgi:hypothetical protein